jgi:polyhydroxyalkanoate synthase
MPSNIPSASAFLNALRTAHFEGADNIRSAQAVMLGLLGLGSRECRFHLVETGPQWRLRAYASRSSSLSPSLLIISAPIKRPYIWDLAPSVSVLRACLDHGLRPYLLEWKAAGNGDRSASLEDYAVEAIEDCVGAIEADSDGSSPFLIGHSLGGTLAAIFCAHQPHAARGLILLASPLCPASRRWSACLAHF